VGHVARCLALAQAWQDGGGDAWVVSREVPASWRRRLEREGVAVVAPERATELPRAEWCVIDGYHFDETDLGGATALGRRLAVVVDHGHGPGVPADLVVDQNLGARAAASTPSLLGPRYALLRRELRTALGGARPAGGRGPTTELSLLVSLGGLPGSAAEAFAERVLADPRLVALSVRRLQHVADVAPELLAADLALAAGGSTAWELCAFGVPAVLFAVADNQEAVAVGLSDEGAALYAGRLAEANAPEVADLVARLAGDEGLRRAITGRATALVDGRGAPRVATAMRGCLLRCEAAPSEAAAGDGRRYVVDDGVRPLGRVTFERAGPTPTATATATATATMEVELEPGVLGSGYAAAVVDAAVRARFAERDIDVVVSTAADGEWKEHLRDADFDPSVGPTGSGRLELRRVRPVPAAGAAGSPPLMSGAPS